MPRGIKQEPSAPGATDSKVDAAGAKGAKATKSKAAAALGVTKPALKKKEGQKDTQKAAVGAGEGGVGLSELEERRKELADQLRKCELQIHRLETQYFEMANPHGNALKGYEGLLSSTAGSSAASKKSQFRAEDRIFSGSSASGASTGA